MPRFTPLILLAAFAGGLAVRAGIATFANVTTGLLVVFGGCLLWVCIEEWV